MSRFTMDAVKFVLLAGSALAAAPGLAQTTDGQVSEVVVTVRKRAETVQDAPLAVNAVTSQTLERQQIESVEDLIKLDSSLIFDRNFSLQDTRPQIRGLPASRGRPAVGVLVDGVDTSSESMGASAGGSQLFNTRLIDVERVEIVKGPQSALYGRVAFGGAINYVTKKPSQTFGADLMVSGGTYGEYEVRGAVTGPINDRIAFRINGYYAHSDGYYENQVSGDNVGGYKSGGGMFSLSYDPTPKFHADTQVSYSEDHYAPAALEYIGSQNNQDVTIPVAPSYLAGPPGAGGPTTVQAPPFGTLGPSPSGVRLSVNPLTGKDFPGAVLKTERYTVHLTYDLGFAQLTSISSVTHARFSERDDDDFFGAPQTTVAGPAPGTIGEPFQRFGIININGGNVVQVNQELRLGKLDGGPFRWAVGGLFWHENYRQNNQSYTSALSGVGASGGLNTAETIGSVPYAPGSRETRHISGYAIVEYDFLHNFTASFEGRYSSEKYDYTFSPYLYTAGAGITAPAPAIIYTTPTPASTGTDFFTPKFLLRYKPSEDLMIYASAAKGEKPGGYNTVSIISSTGNRFGPEKLWNYELGLKSRLFDDRLSFEGALFYMNYTGKQESVIVVNPATVTGFASEIQNVGGAVVKGLEATFAYQPMRELLLSVSYTYLDDKYTDYRVDANSTLTASLIASCTPNTMIGTGVFCQTNLRGHRLELTPTNVVVANGRYSHQLIDQLDGFIESDVRYTSDRPTDEYNVRFIPAQTIANLRIGLETPRWTGLVYIDNVFDQNKIQGAFLAGDMFFPGRTAITVRPADPRTAGVRLTYKW